MKAFLLIVNTFLLSLAVIVNTLESNRHHSSSFTNYDCGDTIPAVILRENGLTKLADLLLTSEDGLVETLSGPGPFTLFAPTDEAFASMSLYNFDAAEDVNLLKDILTYHVAPLEITSAFLSAIQQVYQLPTLQGSAPVRINVYRENERAITLFDPVKTVTINGALALKSLQACNGLIYMIDKVLNPADLMPENDELEIFDRYGLTTVKRILDVLGAVQSVNIFFGPKTLFAPTDAAFAALPPGFLDELLADKKKLLTFINTHVVSGYHYSRGLETGPILSFGAVVDVQVSHGKITYGGANILIPDITNVQGVIHVIDACVLPDLE
ncbi:transforming growth factor-beta-induced protein ig-h3-like [Daphnia pulex]|uniref:transforming growth factor-beta-induced protein ig-h3-like n=1 Tax=Daphnia pulex TaxID=6669 RepID=UPI001EDEECAD|nr:transforming growth factor-beta-induced protein ig-h3-like [Daphnia pulex]